MSRVYASVLHLRIGALCAAAIAAVMLMAQEPSNPADSPSCFLRYQESYSGKLLVLRPDSAIAMTWPVTPARGYAEVRANVSCNSEGRGASRQRWGLRWVSPDSVRHRVALSWGNTNFGDFTDRRYLRVDVLRVDSIVDTHYYYSDVDMHNGANTLAVDFDEGRLRIAVGADHLAESFVISEPVLLPDTLEVWTATPLTVRSVDARAWPDYRALYPPRYTYDELIERISSSTDPLEGFWAYFDRDADESTQIGGRYVVATRATDDGGYDIVMVDGARVSPEVWPCGTIKGRLTPTIFVDTYTLDWRDAAGRWIHSSNELSATVANSSLMTLRFPHIDATVRLSRVPLSQMRAQK